jgi:hypothetical protein
MPWPGSHPGSMFAECRVHYVALVYSRLNIAEHWLELLLRDWEISVQISARRLAFLTDVFRCLRKTLQALARIQA